MKNTIERYYHTWFGINELYAMWARHHGLTVNALFALYLIKNLENCTQQDICKLLMLPKQTVNSLLKALDELGYVAKRANLSDKRSKIIYLTPKGGTYAEELLGKLYKAESNALLAMGNGQVKGLIEGMNSFLENFKRTSEMEDVI